MSTFSTSSRQKRLKTLSFLHFWLRNVLRATTACTFSTLFRHLNLQKWSENGVFCTFWLGNVLRATAACTFSTSQLPKVVREWCVLYILTWKCASRHNCVHFFDIATSKSGPRMVCFAHFDLEMCFAPQRRALFRHRNFQKWSDHGVFCTFWLQNVLRATTACTFSTSQLPKVVRSSSVLSILTWKCASRHNGVHFFMSHLASWLRTRRFSEPTFRPSGATNHWKNTVNRDFPIFSRICIFFLLILSLLTLLTSAFQLSILSEVSLLNFLRLSRGYLGMGLEGTYWNQKARLHWNPSESYALIQIVHTFSRFKTNNFVEDAQSFHPKNPERSERNSLYHFIPIGPPVLCNPCSPSRRSPGPWRSAERGSLMRSRSRA